MSHNGKVPSTEREDMIDHDTPEPRTDELQWRLDGARAEAEQNAEPQEDQWIDYTFNHDAEVDYPPEDLNDGIVPWR